METKEKAKELVYEFLHLLYGNKPFYKKSDFFKAKKCALICVDKILADLKESFEISKDLHLHAMSLIAGSIVVWKEVKIEITKVE